MAESGTGEPVLHDPFLEFQTCLEVVDDDAVVVAYSDKPGSIG